MAAARYCRLAGRAYLPAAGNNHPGGIGGGDIKLIAALGLWLGPSPLKAAALGGIIIGGIWALLAVLLTKKSRRDVIPYGPSFILAALFAYAAYLLPG